MQTSNLRSVRKLLDFLKLYSRMEKYPGFSYATGLDYASVQRSFELASETIHFQKPTLTYRLPIHLEQLQLPHLTNKNASSSPQHAVPLSVWMSLIDDVTTWALVLTDPSSRYGVSVNLRSTWGALPTLSAALELPDHVLIKSTVRKLGRQLAFVEAQIVHPETNLVLCEGQHTKFVNLGYLSEFALGPGWPLTQLYAQYMRNEPDLTQAPRSVAEVLQNLEINLEAHTAAFYASPAAASGGGPLHGGAQAVLMELAASSIVQSVGPYPLYLDSIQVDYMSSPSRHVKLRVKMLSSDGKGMRVCVDLMDEKEKVKSQGWLRFVRQPEAAL